MRKIYAWKDFREILGNVVRNEIIIVALTRILEFFNIDVNINFKGDNNFK